MKAAILREFKTPLTIEDVAQPKPDAHEVLIEVEACGVCHSDLHVADGDWPQLVPITKRPLILGHEIAGRVVEKGASVHQSGNRRPRRRSLGVLDLRRMRFLPRRQRESLRQTKNYWRHRGRRLRRIRQGSRESCHENPRRAFFYRRRASFLRGSHRLSCPEARQYPARPAFGGLRRRRLGALSRANRARAWERSSPPLTSPTKSLHMPKAWAHPRR